jgi:uncharacterized protein with FMN-binding domain
MPKNYAKSAKQRARQLEKQAASAGVSSAAKSSSAQPKHKRRRLTDGLIGVSSAAILTVYGLGYFNTQNTNGELGAEPVSFSPTPTANSQGPLILAPTPTLPPGAYRDGSYTAVGNGRHGPIEATIVIKNGKITSANVSSCGTRYPCSDVNPLINEVLSKQAVPVHYVSGATDSSQSYVAAVKSALAQAS